MEAGGTSLAPGRRDDDADPERHEWKRRALALPIAMLLALAFHAWPTGHFMQRTALTMPLHELGHAIAGWLCGFAAVPTLWKTLIPEGRGLFAPVLVGGAAALLVWRGWVAERVVVWVLGLALGVVLFFGYTASLDTAQLAFTFAGDAGAMILGTLLMGAFFVGPESRLRAGGLRYGLLAIGAAAFVDTFSLWWRARTNTDVIPFGEIEGVGLSDPTKLTEVHGWTDAQLVANYVRVGGVCLVALLAWWAWSVYRARRD